MSTRVRRKFSGPSGILTVSTFLYNLSLSFILGSFCPRRRSGCSPCRKKPIFMHLQHRHSSPRTFPQLAFQSFYFPFLRYRGFLQQFAFFHANAPKLHIQNTQFWRRSFKKIRAAPAAISSETVPQLYFPPKRAEWYCHKAAQPFCIVLTSLFLLITIL